MRLGSKAMEALQAEVGVLLRPGDELIVIGEVALAGTSLIAKQEYAKLRYFFSESFMRDAMNLYHNYGVKPDSELLEKARQAGAGASFFMGEGGFLAALWKLAEASEVGLKVDLRKIPIRQETIEITEKYDMNPYRLFSKGAVILGMPSGESFVQECLRQGIAAAIVGQTEKGKDRLLFSGSNARYLERPAKDEIIGVIKEWQN